MITYLFNKYVCEATVVIMLQVSEILKYYWIFLLVIWDIP